VIDENEPIDEMCVPAGVDGWRDLIRRLDPDQIEELEDWEDGGAHPGQLLGMALHHAFNNQNARKYFGHIDPPAGAIVVKAPHQTADGRWVRAFWGERMDVESTADVTLSVFGHQFTDGSIHQRIDVTYRDLPKQDEYSCLRLGFADALNLCRGLGSMLARISSPDEG